MGIFACSAVDDGDHGVGSFYSTAYRHRVTSVAVDFCGKS
jgi:hypothetical protein